MKSLFLQLLFVVASAALIPVYAQQTPQAAAPDRAKPVEKRANQNLDIVFLIDSSRSMTWSDPEGFRKVAVKAFLDITQDRGGDRIAVLQFAGWNETESAGTVVFPLTEISFDEAEREKVVKEVKEALTTKMTLSGKCTDFNCAFQKGVFPIIQKRKEENALNNLWVVLLTDGEMDVVEEPTVRQEYRDRVIQQGGKINRETLNKAATEIFELQVIPLLAGRKDLFITCVNFSPREPDLLKTLSEKTPCTLFSAGKERLKSVFIKALTSLPAGFYRESLGRGSACTTTEVQPAAEFSDTFHIYEGAKATHLVIFGSNPSFFVDIFDPDNNSIIPGPNVRVAGEGEIYRTITLKNCPSGDYRLACANRSESATLFEKVVYAQLEFLPYVDVSKVQERYLPGQEMTFQLGLKNTDTFAFVKDAFIIRDSDIIIEPIDPQGVPRTRTTLGFAGEGEARKSIAYKIDEKSAGGVWSFNISFGVIRQTLTRKYAYLSDPVRIAASVTSPVIEVRFLQKEAFTEQKIPVTGKVTAGSLSEGDTDRMPFTLTAYNEESGRTADAELDYNAQSQTFSTNLSLSESGNWKLKETSAASGMIVSPSDSAVSVRDRSVRIFKMVNNKREPISEMLATAKDGFFSEAVIVEPDLAPSETAEVSLSYSAISKREHTATFRVDQTEAKVAKYNITGDTPDKLLSIRLSFKRLPRRRQTVGSVIITCKLPDARTLLVREISLICVPVEGGFPLWALLSICAGAVVIVILLRWYLTIPELTNQQLIFRSGPAYPLRDMRIGRGTALGTEQFPGSLLFRLRRPKHSPRCAALAMRKFRLLLDGELKRGWTPLTHGCEISVQTADGGLRFDYRYFDRPPTPEELQAAEAVAESIPEGALAGEGDFRLRFVKEKDLLKPEESVSGASAAAVTPAGEPKVEEKLPTTEEEISVEEELERTFGELFKEDQNEEDEEQK